MRGRFPPQACSTFTISASFLGFLWPSSTAQPRRFSGSAAPRIDQQADTLERENLLAVTQVLAGLRYNDPGLFQILGGRKAMIESPVLQELKAEWTSEAARETIRSAIVEFLVARFGSGAEELGRTVSTNQRRSAAQGTGQGTPQSVPISKPFARRLSPAGG